MKEIRELPGGIIVIDTRKTYVFNLPDGRKAETKADTEEEARKHVEACLELELELQLEEAA